MSVDNEAFIDLEQILHNRVNQLWLTKWRELEKELNRLANEGKWDEAQKIAQNIQLNDIVEEVEQLARTLAEAALFLGASRIVDTPEEASFYGAPDEFLIDRGVQQWSVVLANNATIALQTEAQVLLAGLERKAEEQRLARIVKADPLGKVGRQGSQFSRATAALMISRLSTAGFMLEASHRGIKTYRVSEVMDSATCPVCSLMHNKTYPVADGLALSGAIMQATNPESLKAIAPFPSQSKASITAIGGMSQGQLISGGMNLPPYHPNCRGIATLEVKNSGATLSGLSSTSIAPGSALSSVEDLTPDELAARMFGDYDTDDALLGAVLGAGGAAAFGDNEE